MATSTPIHIKVISEIQQLNDPDKEKIEFQTVGEYYIKENKTYIRYDEEHELGFVKTTLKMSENEVMVMRSGAVTMKQRFSENQLTATDYTTPFGKLQLVTHTKSIKVEKDQQKLQGFIRVIYELEIGENEKHLHTLFIAFKEDIK
ncbi:DUF1934 domain-containing protein [Metabacillus herbersteinensis]|uniref:DUF1934 domain-containing protein n=1 Tax=Metabacillus herbersteinensis TaxID=283816 RepID=A0ABV6GFH5_9BACI